MTNEETLELLKPIMLDGTEKEGDMVYHIFKGFAKIRKINYGAVLPIELDFKSFTKTGFSSDSYDMPVLFKTNPFEYLAKLNNNQVRVIEVWAYDLKWKYAVVIRVVDGVACCCIESDTIEGAKENAKLNPNVKMYSSNCWREIGKSITKEEALKMLAEKGVDTTNLTIE